MDPDHSYHFCGRIMLPPPPPEPAPPTESAMIENKCWQLTMVTTRPLKLLYFDGSSAAKMEGPMYSQDLLAWRETLCWRTGRGSINFVNGGVDTSWMVSSGRPNFLLHLWILADILHTLRMEMSLWVFPPRNILLFRLKLLWTLQRSNVLQLDERVGTSFIP